MKVFGFARDVDRSGQRFYREMAERNGNPGVRNIFNMLAEQERRRLVRVERLAATTDGDETATLERGQNVYEQLRRQSNALHVADDVAAYRLARDAERDVLRQYETAAAAEENPLVKRILAEIAEDERRVMEELENLYEFTSAPNGFLAWGEFSNLGEFRNFGRDGD